MRVGASPLRTPAAHQRVHGAEAALSAGHRALGHECVGLVDEDVQGPFDARGPPSGRAGVRRTPHEAPLVGLREVAQAEDHRHGPVDHDIGEDAVRRRPTAARLGGSLHT